MIVTPCVGVWIETLETSLTLKRGWSHPAWVCGLKHTLQPILSQHFCHTLRGCVD